MRSKKLLLKKIALLTCMLTLSFPSTLKANTGPGEQGAAPPQKEIGPGIHTGADTPAVVPDTPAVVPENSVDYFLQPLSNPIVLEWELYTYDQMSEDIRAMQQLYGDRMKVTSIGQTPDNREIYDIIVGNPDAGRHVMIQGSLHAREYITSQLLMKQLEYTLAFYHTGTYNNQFLSSMLNQVAVHFIPMTNPDGVTISQWGDGGIVTPELRQNIQNCYQTDLASGRTSLSYNRYLQTWKANAKGVDLNYNFDASWNEAQVSSHQPAAQGYKGPNPLSEPETSALAVLLTQYPFKAILNYHAMGQVIYWDAPQNLQAGASLHLAQLISQSSGYQILNSKGMLGFKDWVQTKPDAIPSITIEVGRSRCPVSIAEFPEIWAKNRPGLAQTMDFVIKSY